MKFFLDTASLDEIDKWQELGLVDGVTTNPCLLADLDSDPREALASILEAVDGPVSIQVTDTANVTGMVQQGRWYAAMGDNVVVKLPATLIGYHAASQLSEEGIALNATLVFHPAQAVPFVRLGVAYVSMVIGKAEDAGDCHLDHVSDLAKLIHSIRGPTKMIACSIRNPRHLIHAICAGADVLTVPPRCWELVYSNPDLLAALREMGDAWKAVSDEYRHLFAAAPVAAAEHTSARATNVKEWEQQ